MNNIIPSAKSNAPSGYQFIQNNMQLGGSLRERNILKEFLEGNIPDFLKNLIPIQITLGSNTITYSVMPDVLSIGHELDYVRMPMNPHTAQIIADKYDCTLPTKKMSYDIWKAATNKLTPKPWGLPYNQEMYSTSRFDAHNNIINNQLIHLDYRQLTAGHKKDIVLTNKLAPNNPARRVAIYGWFNNDGSPIQGLNPADHDDLYEDYSHGVRMIANDVIINGNPMRIQDVFKDQILNKLVSDEGILAFTRY